MSETNKPLVTTVIPPKPPDLQDSMEVEITPNTFKDALLNKEKEINRSDSIYDGTLLDPQDAEQNTIELSDSEKQRIYQPWRLSVIIKLFLKILGHAYLRNKLTNLWKLKENLILIDLGNDFVVAKFTLNDSLEKVLNEGSWFVTGSFLTIRR